MFEAVAERSARVIKRWVQVFNAESILQDTGLLLR